MSEILPGQLWRHRDRDESLEVVAPCDGEPGMYRVKVLRGDDRSIETVSAAFIWEFYPIPLGRWHRSER